ncbi:hypothetical protein F4781DRAFT_437713 [Annulohypoxylon bovei var. microspora]|nr:hypothetical protein F4781DRAFT_437713 [Annulohypoxylon bovei var. microspora]
MPRPVETLDIALPTDHPLKRPVSNRNKQTAQRIYQLWNVWPWQLFPINSPHLPTIWTDNLLDKLKTIALCTTLPHARDLLGANVPDGQPLSLAVLNAVIDECKEGSDTPRNPAVRSRKRRRGRTAAERHRLGEDEDDRGDIESSLGLDDNDEEDEGSIYEHGNDQQEARSSLPLFSPIRRLRGRSLAAGYGMSTEPIMQLSKRQKRRHYSSMPHPLAYITPPESTLTSGPASNRHVSQPNPTPRFRFADPTQPQPSDGVAAYVESVVVRLSGLFQEQRRSCERAVEETRSQLGAIDSRMESLESQLSAVKRDVAEVERQKVDMENTCLDLLAIEKEEDGLAARRRELMARRTSGLRRQTSSLSLSDEQSQAPTPPSQPRASDDLRTDIDTLVVDQLQPLRDREAALKLDIASAKANIEAARAKVDASLVDLNTKSDELIRWRGLSNDIQDALIRRGFAEPAFMWEFGQKDTDRRERPGTGFTSSAPVSRAATAAGGFGSPPDPNHDQGTRTAIGLDAASSPGSAGTPVRSRSASQLEGRRRYGSV